MHLAVFSGRIEVGAQGCGEGGGRAGRASVFCEAYPFDPLVVWVCRFAALVFEPQGQCRSIN